MVKVERKVWSLLRILDFIQTSERTIGLEEQYEKLANLIGIYGGRIHGSQYTGHTIAVYFEIPKDNKDEFLKEEEQ